LTTEQARFESNAAEYRDVKKDGYVVLNLNKPIDHMLEVILKINLRVVKILFHAKPQNG